jgi:hypothetical protein
MGGVLEFELSDAIVQLHQERLNYDVICLDGFASRAPFAQNDGKPRGRAMHYACIISEC